MGLGIGDRLKTFAFGLLALLLVILLLEGLSGFLRLAYDIIIRFQSPLAERSGISFIDLVENFKRLGAAEVESLFITWDTRGSSFAAGHSSVPGNEFIASAL